MNQKLLTELRSFLWQPAIVNQKTFPASTSLVQNVSDKASHFFPGFSDSLDASARAMLRYPQTICLPLSHSQEVAHGSGASAQYQRSGQKAWLLSHLDTPARGHTATQRSLS